MFVGTSPFLLFYNLISTACIFFRFSFSRESNRCGSTFRNSEVPNPLVAFVTPSTLDETGCRLVFSIDVAQPLVRYRLHDDVLEARLSWVG